MRCSRCGAEVGENAKFCSKCGNTLKIICPKCKKELPPGSKFCVNCGAVLDSEKTPVPTERKRENVRPSAGKKEKKSPVILLLCILIGLLLLGGAVGGGCYLFLRSQTSKEAEADRNEEKKKDEEQGEAEEEETEEEEQEKEEEESSSPETEAYPTQPVQTEVPASPAYEMPSAGYETPTQPYYEQNPSAYGSSDYIIPDSAVRYLTESDIAALTKEELRLARNEIYARHGRMFNDSELQDYFNSKPWYYGTVRPQDFNADILNDCEKKNLILIQKRESQLP